AAGGDGRLVRPGWEPRNGGRGVIRGGAWGGGPREKKKGRRPPPPAPGASAGAVTADIGVVDLDPWPGGAKQVTAVPFDHRLHQLVLDPPGGVGRDPEPATQFDVGQALLSLSLPMHGAKTKPHPHAGAPQSGTPD